MPNDFDGDGLADLLTVPFRGEEGPSVVRWLPGSGAASRELVATDSVWFDRPMSADLNGDTCADMVIPSGATLQLLLGSASGPTVSGASATMQLPEGDVADGYSLIGGDVAVSRHDGMSQIFVTGVGYNDGAVGSTSMWVHTVNAAATTTSVSRMNLATYGVNGDDGSAPTVAADGRLVVVGNFASTVSGSTWAGAVHIFESTPTNRAKFAHKARLTQNSAGIAGTPEQDDRFGTAVAVRDGYIAIGVNESIGSIKAAGMVQPIRWNSKTGSYTAYRAIHQGTQGVPGANEKNDKFGEVLAIGKGLTASDSHDIVIGTPLEDIGSSSNAGSVTVANFSKAIYRGYNQNSAGVPGVAEKGDYFGNQVLSLRPLASSQAESVVAVAPGERNTGCSTVGLVEVSVPGRLSSATTWSMPVKPCNSTAMANLNGEGNQNALGIGK